MNAVSAGVARCAAKMRSPSFSRSSSSTTTTASRGYVGNAASIGSREALALPDLSSPSTPPRA